MVSHVSDYNQYHVSSYTYHLPRTIDVSWHTTHNPTSKQASITSDSYTHPRLHLTVSCSANLSDCWESLSQQCDHFAMYFRSEKRRNIPTTRYSRQRLWLQCLCRHQSPARSPFALNLRPLCACVNAVPDCLLRRGFAIFRLLLTMAKVSGPSTAHCLEVLLNDGTGSA